MINRSENIKSILPDINTSPATVEIEQFQNEVLRPILKFQHEVLVTYVKCGTTLFQHLDLNKIHVKDLRLKLQQEISNNTRTRQCLLGMVIGLMTVKELNFYVAHKNSCRKRIFSMLIERLVDGLSV